MPSIPRAFTAPAFTIKPASVVKSSADVADIFLIPSLVVKYKLELSSKYFILRRSTSSE